MHLSHTICAAGIERITQGISFIDKSLGARNGKPVAIGDSRKRHIGLYRTSVFTGLVSHGDGDILNGNTILLGLDQFHLSGKVSGADRRHGLTGRIIGIFKDGELHLGRSGAAEAGSHHPVPGDFHLPRAVGRNGELRHLGNVAHGNFCSIHLQPGSRIGRLGAGSQDGGRRQKENEYFFHIIGY